MKQKRVYYIEWANRQWQLTASHTASSTLKFEHRMTWAVIWCYYQTVECERMCALHSHESEKSHKTLSWELFFFIDIEQKPKQCSASSFTRFNKINSFERNKFSKVLFFKRANVILLLSSWQITCKIWFRHCLTIKSVRICDWKCTLRSATHSHKQTNH